MLSSDGCWPTNGPYCQITVEATSITNITVKLTIGVGAKH